MLSGDFGSGAGLLPDGLLRYNALTHAPRIRNSREKWHMRVLVIGGTGLISTAIVARLIETGHGPVLFNRGTTPRRFSQDVESARISPISRRKRLGCVAMPSST